jgi:hypothetical protein
MSAFRMGAVALAVFAASCASQPDPQCSVGRASIDGSTGSHAVVYTLKDGQDATRACAKLTSGKVGLQKFYPDGPNRRGTLGMRVDTAGELLADESSRVTVNNANALGEFSANAPAADGFCQVPSLSLAEVVLEMPAQRLAWEWSNVRVYNTAAIPGTQFAAELKYTEDDCTAEYTVKGIWPVVSCKTDSACNPKPNPDAGQTRGSGINPLFPVKCDSAVGICVLAGEVPSEE